MLTALVGAALQVAVSAGAALPPYVSTATRAVGAGDANLIDRQFGPVEEVSDAGSVTIDGRKVVELLAGCQPGEARVLESGVYAVDYRCPARQKSAAGCDSGDLFLMLSAERGARSLAVAHRRKISPDCPVFAPPPPPPPVDEAVARAFVEALVADDQAAVEKMVTDGSFVATVQRFPGSKDVKEVGNSRGLAELRKQFAFLTGQLGRPKGVACRKEQLFEFCKFDLVKTDRILLAFVNTSGSGIHTIRFDYAIRGDN